MFGLIIEKEDQEVGSSPLSSRSIMSSPSVYYQENHYSNREVDELDEQKVNFKSQPNKEKRYLCILPVVTHSRPMIYLVLLEKLPHRSRRL